ncbi:hypothetical protein B0D78_10595 [Pyramidobacter sp. C12-8]|nr:hypothetical protein B0D78_10595 [Pyramidobacter sp. C12-8]
MKEQFKTRRAQRRLSRTAVGVAKPPPAFGEKSHFGSIINVGGTRVELKMFTSSNESIHIKIGIPSHSSLAISSAELIEREMMDMPHARFIGLLSSREKRSTKKFYDRGETHSMDFIMPCSENCSKHFSIFR